MIAVVYSGSRYANWKLADKGEIISEIKTVGINPLINDERFIIQLLNKTNELVTYAEKIKRICFFGAGTHLKQQKEILLKAFSSFFIHAKIQIDTDLKATALASCGDHKGIVGIIGSGSNAAYFNGRKLVKNNYGLGYILADEGSANWLGRKLLKSFLNDLLPINLREKFIEKYDLDYKQILEKVYKQPQPVLFLSSFADFVRENREDGFIKDMVVDGLEKYLTLYINPLVKINPNTPIYFAGSIASIFQDWLREVAAKKGLNISMVIREPIYNILHYYSNKN